MRCSKPMDGRSQLKTMQRSSTLSPLETRLNRTLKRDIKGSVDINELLQGRN